MVRPLLLAVAVSLSACSASLPAETPAAALPTVPAGASAVAVAQPVAPTGDATLDAFLATLAAAIDRHDWRGVAELSAPGPLDAAFVAGRAAGDAPRDAAARGVAQLLGLADLATGPDPFARLDAVRVVTLRSAATVNDAPGVRYEVEGDLRFTDGGTVPLSFYVGALGDGYGVVPIGGAGVGR